MTGERRLRIAVCGAGMMGRMHARTIAARADCELAALVDPLSGTQTFANELQVPLYLRLDAMLTALRPDGVILATPNTQHVEGALQCLAQRVPCLVEKPVADTLADAERLCAAAEKSGAPVLVGHHRRHGAILREAAAVVASGRLGRLVAISGTATFRKPDDYFEQARWRREPGGGPVLTNMVHEVDNLRALAGEIVEVQAMASSAARGFEVEDTVAISLRFESGALGSFLLSDAAASPRSWEQTSGENPAYDRHADEDCYVLAGTRGSLTVPTMRLRTYAAGETSWWAKLATTRLALDPVDPIAAQLAHFCQVVRGETPSKVGAADATRTLAVTLAIARSARESRPVTLH